MALDAISSSSNDLLNFMIYEKLYGNPLKHTTSFQDDSMLPYQDNIMVPTLTPPSCFHEKCEDDVDERAPNLATQGRKKRRRRTKICKNKEETEAHRMTHIAVERNRRKQMNDHLSVLRSLMPQSYAPKGDQASIVGGAIEYVKELEHLHQTLQAQKFTLLNQGGGGKPTTTSATSNTIEKEDLMPPFAEFFSYPQHIWSQSPTKNNYKVENSVAEIEVRLMESHANLRILAKRSHRQLSKLIAGLQLLHFSILHINVTSLDPLVLYCINAKVEEGCQLTSVDEIAQATNHMLGSIEEEAAELC